MSPLGSRLGIAGTVHLKSIEGKSGSESLPASHQGRDPRDIQGVWPGGVARGWPGGGKEVARLVEKGKEKGRPGARASLRVSREYHQGVIRGLDLGSSCW